MRPIDAAEKRLKEALGELSEDETIRRRISDFRVAAFQEGRRNRDAELVAVLGIMTERGK